MVDSEAIQMVEGTELDDFGIVEVTDDEMTINIAGVEYWLSTKTARLWGRKFRDMADGRSSSLRPAPDVDFEPGFAPDGGDVYTIHIGIEVDGESASDAGGIQNVYMKSETFERLAEKLTSAT